MLTEHRVSLKQGSPTPEEIDSGRVGRPGQQTKVIVEQRSFGSIAEYVGDWVRENGVGVNEEGDGSGG